MEFTEHDTAFDPAGDAHVDGHLAGMDNMTAEHDSSLGGTDDHYSMIANSGDNSDGSNSYGDSTNSGESAGYGGAGGNSGSYGDSSAYGGGSTGTASAGSVSIMVDGHTYTGPGHIDSQGYNEAEFQLPDGDRVIAEDSNHDGQADVAVIENSSGQVIDQQHVDPTSGQWIDDGAGGSGSGGGSYPSDGSDSTGGTNSSPTTASGDGSDGYPSDGSNGGSQSTSSSPDSGSSDSGTATTAAAGTVHVTVDGQTYTATEMYDANHSGHANSGIVEVDGKTYYLTDFNGDGNADHVEVLVNGEWKGGYSIENGQFIPDPGTTPDPSDLPGGGYGFTDNTEYAVDPQTGEWTTH